VPLLLLLLLLLGVLLLNGTGDAHTPAELLQCCT
jgi:hypothetical protein